MGAVALPLAFAGVTPAAAPQAATAPSRAAPDAAAGHEPWVADELRILRADVESLRQRPDASVRRRWPRLRSEVARLAAAQADLERRLGVAPAAEPHGDPGRAQRRGVGFGGALVFLVLGAALGWVGGRLTQRWRDRRQRIRV